MIISKKSSIIIKQKIPKNINRVCNLYTEIYTNYDQIKNKKISFLNFYTNIFLDIFKMLQDSGETEKVIKFL